MRELTAKAKVDLLALGVQGVGWIEHRPYVCTLKMCGKEMSTKNPPLFPYDFETPTKLRGEPKTLLLTVSSGLPTPPGACPGISVRCLLLLECPRHLGVPLHGHMLSMLPLWAWLLFAAESP